MSILINLLLGIFVLVSSLLILIVLMQRPKSEGLGAAFGGGMTENLFGAQTTNVLGNATRYLGAFFFILALILSMLYAKQSQRKSALQQELIKTAPPVAIPLTSPAASPAASAAPSASAAGSEKSSPHPAASAAASSKNSQ